MIKELIALACCDNPTEREYFCQMITYRTSSIHNATCTFYLQGCSINVKHGTRCAMGKVVGKQKKPKRGGILMYYYKFAVLGYLSLIIMA